MNIVLQIIACCIGYSISILILRIMGYRVYCVKTPPDSEIRDEHQKKADKFE